MPLTEGEKLIWAGLKDSTFKENPWNTQIDELIALYTFSQIQDKFSNDWASWSDFESDVSGSITDYSAFEDKLKSIYTDWADFEDHFLNQYNDYEDFRNEFTTGLNLGSDATDSEGNPVAGIRIHEEDGIRYDGVTVSAGSVEIYGNEVHASKTAAPRAEDGSISYSNFSVSDTQPAVGTSTTASVDVTNTNTGSRTVVTEFTVDGEVVDQDRREVSGGGTETVQFTYSEDEYVCKDVDIEGQGPTTVCWVPAGLAII